MKVANCRLDDDEIAGAVHVSGVGEHGIRLPC
jgi:hypothetical protein